MNKQHSGEGGKPHKSKHGGKKVSHLTEDHEEKKKDGDGTHHSKGTTLPGTVGGHHQFKHKAQKSHKKSHGHQTKKPSHGQYTSNLKKD